mmetsp:Transcript_5409/g.7828  ORF Transcript_5409/g.7828 Transcript_5409/m.7828 type:complete len:88 (-) Transcript_5409:940-1203(-)
MCLGFPTAFGKARICGTKRKGCRSSLAPSKNIDESTTTNHYYYCIKETSSLARGGILEHVDIYTRLSHPLLFENLPALHVFFFYLPP